MKHGMAWVISGLIVSCAGAGGTETANPATLEQFGASECKNRAPDPAPQALVRESEVEGLQCVEWSRDDSGRLRFRLSNFPEGCGDEYLGAAKLADDGALELSVYKDTCEVLRCGSCLFDFDFRVNGVASDAALALRTGAAVCESKPVSWDEAFRLPVDQQSSGLVCRYVRRNVLEQYATTRGTCGERNMPCGDCSSAGPQTCGEGLTCSAVTDGDSRCLVDCSSDEDCGSATTCQDGLCRSKLDW